MVRIFRLFNKIPNVYYPWQHSKYITLSFNIFQPIFNSNFISNFIPICCLFQYYKYILGSVSFLLYFPNAIICLRYNFILLPFVGLFNIVTSWTVYFLSVIKSISILENKYLLQVGLFLCFLLPAALEYSHYSISE